MPVSTMPAAAIFTHLDIRLHILLYDALSSRVLEANGSRPWTTEGAFVYSTPAAPESHSLTWCHLASYVGTNQVSRMVHWS